LALALGFECVNGFHNTANAVATVIYTRSLPPWLAVIWPGICNFVGVLVSTGTVASEMVHKKISYGVLNLVESGLVWLNWVERGGEEFSDSSGRKGCLARTPNPATDTDWHGRTRRGKRRRSRRSPRRKRGWWPFCSEIG
jgi:hypothetical protein